MLHPAMSAYTPRPPPPPQSTPAVHPDVSRRASRPPILNPYDKFNQTDFDAWIGGITGALRSALGQEENNYQPQDVTLEMDHDEDYVEDSFADIKARRAISKGKARDPREGPGLGDGWNQAEPIEILSGSDGDEEADSPRLNEGDSDSEDGRETENFLEGEDEDEDERHFFDGEDSSDEEGALEHEASLIEKSPQREGRGSLIENFPVGMQIAEVYDEQEEAEELEEEYEDSDAERSVSPVRKPQPRSPIEIIDLESDGDVQPDYSDNEPEEYQTRPSPFHPMDDDDDYKVRGRDVEPEEVDIGGVDAADQDEEDEEVQPLEDDTSFPPRSEQSPELRQEIRDPWAGPRDFAEDYYSGGDAPLLRQQQLDAHNLAGDNEEPSVEKREILHDDSAFLPELPVDLETPPAVEIRDVWEGPEIYAQDYYSGGDFNRVREEGLEPHHLGPEKVERQNVDRHADDDLDSISVPSAFPDARPAMEFDKSLSPIAFSGPELENVQLGETYMGHSDVMPFETADNQVREIPCQVMQPVDQPLDETMEHPTSSISPVLSELAETDFPDVDFELEYPQPSREPSMGDDMGESSLGISIVEIENAKFISVVLPDMVESTTEEPSPLDDREASPEVVVVDKDEMDEVETVEESKQDKPLQVDAEEKAITQVNEVEVMGDATLVQGVAVEEHENREENVTREPHDDQEDQMHHKAVPSENIVQDAIIEIIQEEIETGRIDVDPDVEVGEISVDDYLEEGPSVAHAAELTELGADPQVDHTAKQDIPHPREIEVEEVWDEDVAKSVTVEEYDTKCDAEDVVIEDGDEKEVQPYSVTELYSDSGAEDVHGEADNEDMEFIEFLSMNSSTDHTLPFSRGIEEELEGATETNVSQDSPPASPDRNAENLSSPGPEPPSNQSAYLEVSSRGFTVEGILLPVDAVGEGYPSSVVVTEIPEDTPIAEGTINGQAMNLAALSESEHEQQIDVYNNMRLRDSQEQLSRSIEEQASDGPIDSLLVPVVRIEPENESFPVGGPHVPISRVKQEQDIHEEEELEDDLADTGPHPLSIAPSQLGTFEPPREEVDLPGFDLKSSEPVQMVKMPQLLLADPYPRGLSIPRRTVPHSPALSLAPSSTPEATSQLDEGLHGQLVLIGQPLDEEDSSDVCRLVDVATTVARTTEPQDTSPILEESLGMTDAADPFVAKSGPTVPSGDGLTVPGAGELAGNTTRRPHSVVPASNAPTERSSPRKPPVSKTTTLTTITIPARPSSSSKRKRGDMSSKKGPGADTGSTQKLSRKKSSKAKDKLDSDFDGPLDGEEIHFKPWNKTKPKEKALSTIEGAANNPVPYSASTQSGSSVSSAVRFLRRGSRASSTPSISSEISDQQNQSSPTTHKPSQSKPVHDHQPKHGYLASRQRRALPLQSTAVQPPSLFHTHGKRKVLQLQHHRSMPLQLPGPPPQLQANIRSPVFRVPEQPSVLQDGPTTSYAAHSPQSEAPQTPTIQSSHTPTQTTARRSHSMKMVASNSPVTRSHCRFHKISIPKYDAGPRIFFIVPGCSLTKPNIIEEEEIEDHGDATYEESKRMLDNIELLGFEPYLIAVLKSLVGADIMQSHDIYYLPLEGEKLEPISSSTQGPVLTASASALAKGHVRLQHSDEEPMSETEREIDSRDSDYDEEESHPSAKKQKVAARRGKAVRAESSLPGKKPASNLLAEQQPQPQKVNKRPRISTSHEPMQINDAPKAKKVKLDGAQMDATT